jgi:hypothetical protein
MDAAKANAYLETDKPENVRFYERFGFEVVREEVVLGVPNSYMLRPAPGSAASTTGTAHEDGRASRGAA